MKHWIQIFSLITVVCIMESALGLENASPLESSEEAKMPEYLLPNDWHGAEERLSLRDSALNKETQGLLAQYVKPGGRCLEIGSGNGSITRWLAKQVGGTGHVVGIDISPMFTDADAEEYDNIDILTEDITDNSLAENSFDLIFSREVMIHLTGSEETPMDHPALVEKLVAALKPGGYLIFEDVAGWDKRHLYGFEENGADVKELMRRFSDEALRYMDLELPNKHPFHFRRAGLQLIEADRVERIISGGNDFLKMIALSMECMVDQNLLTIQENEKEAYQKLMKILNHSDQIFWSQGRVKVVGKKLTGNNEEEKLDGSAKEEL